MARSSLEAAACRFCWSSEDVVVSAETSTNWVRCSMNCTSSGSRTCCRTAGMIGTRRLRAAATSSRTHSLATEFAVTSSTITEHDRNACWMLAAHDASEDRSCPGDTRRFVQVRW